MNQYLLATYAIDGQVPGFPETPEAMQAFMQNLMTLEAEMDVDGAFVFSGGLQMQGDNIATVISPENGENITKEGTFTGSGTQMAGFYIINAENLDVALDWANRVAKATNHPIEVRPF